MSSVLNNDFLHALTRAFNQLLFLYVGLVKKYISVGYLHNESYKGTLVRELQFNSSKLCFSLLLEMALVANYINCLHSNRTNSCE